MDVCDKYPKELYEFFLKQPSLYHSQTSIKRLQSNRIIDESLVTQISGIGNNYNGPTTQPNDNSIKNKGMRQ
jgi:hypothetical protein